MVYIDYGRELIWPKALGCSFLGFLYGACLLIITAMMSGAGHGWTSPLILGSASVCIVPFVGVAWAYRASIVGRIVALVVIVMMLLADDAFISAQANEPDQYFQMIWDGGELFVIFWAGLTILWQVLACWIFAISWRRRS
jgi:hypothetical protein